MAPFQCPSVSWCLDLTDPTMGRARGEILSNVSTGQASVFPSGTKTGSVYGRRYSAIAVRACSIAGMTTQKVSAPRIANQNMTSFTITASCP